MLKNISHTNIRVRRGQVVWGDVLYAPGGVCGPRKQSDYQLVILHRGRLDLKLDREWISVLPGHAILLSPHHREHFFFDRQRETHHSWCSIHPAAIPARLRRKFRRRRGPYPFGGMLDVLLRAGRESVLADERALEDGFHAGLGIALFCAFLAQESPPPVSPGDRILARMEKTIRGEYQRPLSLGELARSSGASPQHLLRLCRQHHQATPLEQLYATRLAAAADLLLHSGLSIADVAERSGFVQSFHFSRRFRQAYGSSPRAWRNAHWAKTEIPRAR